MELYLVDGTFEVFRCFQAADPARTSTGQEVGAARAFFHTIVSLLRADGLTHVAVAFDSVVSRVDRNDRSDSALRRSQFPLAADIVRALGITVWPMSRFQADDAIATGACRFQNDVTRVVVCSNDNDFAQCVRSDRVVRLNRITKQVWDEAAVVERFGVRPRQIPSFFALVGDPSDGIPGLPGFGPKAAAVLLARFEDVEQIPKEVGQWPQEIRGQRKLAAIFAERRDEAILYRNLSTLRIDVPLPHTIEDLSWKGADRRKVEEVVARMEAPELLERTIHYCPRS